MTAPVEHGTVSWAEGAAALPYPGDDPTAVETVAARLFDTAQHLARTGDALFDARTALPAAWRGTAADTGDAELSRVRTAVDEGTGRLYRARGALFDVADTLTAARLEVDRLRVGWLAAEGEVRGLRLTIQLAGAAGTGLQDALRLAELRRDGVVADWRDVVARVDAGAAAATRTLLATISGAPVFRAGRGTVTGDLGSALGTDGMVSDDVFRSGLRRAPDADTAWAGLGPAAQAFGLAAAGPLPASPAARAVWWRGRSWTEQQAVLHADPGAVGAADGLPAAIRHQANLLALQRREAALDAALAVGDPALAGRPVTVDAARYGRGYGISAGVDSDEHATAAATAMALAALRTEKATITAVRTQLSTPRSRPLYLLAVDPAGRGTAVVAIGDPDGAAAVATYVPGTGSDAGTLGAELDRADAWGSGAAEFGTHDVSTIAWIGYAAPSDVGVAAFDASADAAAAALVGFQQGLRVAHRGRPARATVVAHSYGGLVVAAAATGGRSLAADQLVLVASTGLEVDAVSDLRLDGVPAAEMGERVHAVRHENDAIRHTEPVHGGDPYDPAFGAEVTITGARTVMPAWWEAFDVLPDPLDAWDAVAAHSAYQEPGSVEQRLISAEIVGRPGVP